MIRKELMDNLEKAIDFEAALSDCYKYLASLIHNGITRQKYLNLSSVSQGNRLLLEKFLNRSNINYALEEKCQFCKITPASFSLEGAINFALEVNNYTIILYKKLSKRCPDESLSFFLGETLKEKKTQIRFLGKEKRFHKENHLRSRLLKDIVRN